MAWIVAMVVGVAPAMAAQQNDPDWPCVQRKVPTLTVAQMWAGPAPAEGWEDDVELRELARRLAARRVPIPEVAEAAADFADDLPPEERGAELAALFAAMLARLNAERGEIIGGIARYARGQRLQAERVGETQRELAALEAEPEASRDAARVAAARELLLWETRVFKDRAQSLSYVCEAPVLLERRAFELARALQGLT